MSDKLVDAIRATGVITEIDYVRYAKIRMDHLQELRDAAMASLQTKDEPEMREGNTVCAWPNCTCSENCRCPSYKKGDLSTPPIPDEPASNYHAALRASSIASELLEALKEVNDVADQVIDGNEEKDIGYARIIDIVSNASKKAAKL